MQLITYSLTTMVNYGHEYALYRGLFDKTFNKELDLFDQHGVPSRSACFIPKQWSTIILDTMDQMLHLDPKLKFNKIYERYGKLIIEIIPHVIDDDLLEELLYLKHEAQNRIDNVTQGILYRRTNSLNKCDRKWLLQKGRIKT